MRITRRFLLAPSLARLIEKERAGYSVTEGYFADRPDRSTYVRVEKGRGTLVLVTGGVGEAMEEPTEMPRAHAEALLDLAAGRVGYRRIPLSLGTDTAQVSRFMTPGALDLISIAFEREEHARAFQPLPWFGPEVTTESSYHTRSISLAGLPDIPEVEPSDAALHRLLDTLENRGVSRHPQQPRAWLKERAAR